MRQFVHTQSDASGMHAHSRITGPGIVIWECSALWYRCHNKRISDHVL